MEMKETDKCHPKSQWRQENELFIDKAIKTHFNTIATLSFFIEKLGLEDISQIVILLGE